MKIRLLFFIIIPQIIFCQDFQTKKADDYFKKTYYSKAIPLYEASLNKKTSNETLLNLADAYHFTFQVEKASPLYGKVLAKKPKLMTNKHLFRYVQTLKAINNYQKAYKIEALYSSYTPEKHRNKLRYLENVTAIGNRYDIASLYINTKDSEFVSSVYNDQLIYSATKKNHSFFEKMYYWNNKPYLNLYTISLDSLNQESSVKLFSEALTTKFHESNAVFTSDGKTVYFTRNNYLNGKTKKDSANVNQLQIYQAQLINGAWENITSLPINYKNFSTEHPALSPDDKILYFSSNRPGGFGGFDIYQVATNDFTDVKNLGAHINTHQKEQFPFIDHEGNLYFSSDGHSGFGFLDVFISKNQNGHFLKPDNVGFPINSGFDDFGFMINSETKKGFFSSNRPSGEGSDDIYQIKETLPLLIENCYQYITGVVQDKYTKEVLANATVVLYTNNIQKDTVITGSNGEFKFKVVCASSYKITGQKTNYEPDSTVIHTSKIRKKENKTVLSLLSFKRINELKKEEKLKQQKQLEIVKANKKRAKENRIKSIVANEKAIIKKESDYYIKTEPIYFDYDLWYMRKESRATLQNVISLMKKYPNMKIEIGTHTDIRGNTSYNKELSQKRSHAVQQYLSENKIDISRIVATGYGEKFPIIYCATEEACTEEQHEINRRCEFKILNFE